MEAVVAMLPLPAKIQGFGLDLDTKTWVYTWRMTKWEDYALQYGLMLFYYTSIVLVQRHVDASKAKTGGKYVLPFWFGPVRKAHNIGLCALSVWLFVTQASVLYSSGTFGSFNTAACALETTEGLYGLASFIFVVSKIWEWLDTYFLIMMGKKVIFLHWFHHMTTLHSFILMANLPSGKWVFLNAFVHILMYAHYHSPQAWARPLITTLQIVQFITGLSFHFYIMAAGPGCFDYTGKGLTYETVASGVIVSVFLIEFLKFFVSNYIRPKPKRIVPKKHE